MKFERKTLLLAGVGVVLALLLLSCIAASISLRYRAPAGEEQPKVTDWMQAWGSLGGVLAGLLAAGAAGALLWHERRRADAAERQLAEDREEAARNLASLVSVTPAGFSTTDGLIRGVGLTVYNHGATPVRNVVVVVPLPDDGRKLMLPPVWLVQPGADRMISHQYQGMLIRVDADWSPADTKVPADVYFTDHIGRAWRRSSADDTERVSTPYPIGEVVSPDRTPRTARQG